MALALYGQASYGEVLRCLLEGLQWLREPALTLRVAGNSGISQARTRLGWEPLRQLHDEVVKPIALAATQGAWYRQWRLVSLDGSTMDVADEQANEEAFARAVEDVAQAFPEFGCRHTGARCSFLLDGIVEKLRYLQVTAGNDFGHAGLYGYCLKNMLLF